MLIPVAVRSKAYVCTCSFAGIAGSNPAAELYIRLLCLLCVVWVAASSTCCSFVQRSLTVCLRVRVCVCLCLILCNLETLRVRQPRAELSCCATE
jgi:hypothetical protein